MSRGSTGSGHCSGGVGRDCLHLGIDNYADQYKDYSITDEHEGGSGYMEKQNCQSKPIYAEKTFYGRGRH
ncbi:hypothetical protein TNCV_1975151 [Trichonephila clavipes]|nr:hypothetical protein TNCV_1975151 [Trichonephila clavipes]